MNRSRCLLTLVSIATVLMGCKSSTKASKEQPSEIPSVTASKSQSSEIGIDVLAIQVTESVRAHMTAGARSSDDPWLAGAGRHFVVVSARIEPGKHLGEALDPVLSAQLHATSICLGGYENNALKECQFWKDLASFSVIDEIRTKANIVTGIESGATFTLYSPTDRPFQFLFSVPDGRRALELEIRATGNLIDPLAVLPVDIRATVRATAGKFRGNVSKVQEVRFGREKISVKRGLVASLMGLHSDGQATDRKQLVARISEDDRFAVVSDEESAYAVFLETTGSDGRNTIGALPLFFKRNGEATFGILKSMYPKLRSR
jgi:hypothetical protein